MKGAVWAKFVVVILIIAGLAAISVYGIPSLDIPNAKNMRFSTDIKGGVNAVLEPSKEDKSKVTDAGLDAAKAVIGKRLESQGVFDYYVNVEYKSATTDGRILLEFPWNNTQKDRDPNKALDEIGKTAILTFREYDPNVEQAANKEVEIKASTSPEATKASDDKATETAKASDDKTKETPKASPETSEDKKVEETTKPTDAPKAKKPSGKVVLEGKNVISAKPEISQQTQRMVVKLKLNAEGTKTFADGTSKNVGKQIAIYMDDQLISAPTVNEAITTGEAVITVGGTAEEAMTESKKLADTISAGNLTFKLSPTSVNSISATLGEKALKVSVYAFIIAFILIFLFMIIFYRLPGLMAVIAIGGLALSQVVFFILSQVTLSLPGIAGIILSVGMGVDANIIIFARVKEEYKAGKTLSAALDLGFKRAFSAIFDSNLTTLISAIVLYMLGSGPMKGFGLALGIGVVLSFIFAITVTRILLYAAVSIISGKNSWLYGVRRDEK